MLPDPIVPTFTDTSTPTFALTKVLPNKRIYSGQGGASDITLAVSQYESAKRLRHEVRMTFDFVRTVGGIATPVSMSAILTFDEPSNGAFSDSEVLFLKNNLHAVVTDTLCLRIRNGEM